jgi:hypothetical protein
VYLTDNDFGLRDGGSNPDKQLPNGIYRIKDGPVDDGARRDGAWRHPELASCSRRDERYLYANAWPRMMRLRGEGRRFARAGQPVHAGAGHRRRHEGGHAGQRLLHKRRRPRHRPHHVTDRNTSRLSSICPIVGGEPKKQICATNVAFGDLDAKSLYVTPAITSIAFA